MIVSTHGRIPNSDQDYRAVENSEYTNIPMVVLANRRSASASEIVTGALQDHDRALVVGETTWGKALVQSIYRLSEGAGLALTTAHYFTPSGRLIQRPWDETFDEYLSYTMRDQDPNKQHPASDLKYTVRLGRKVYSGGGIEPDHRVDGPIEGFNPAKFGRRLYPTMFANFARRFDRDGDTRFGAATDAKARHAITGDFVVDDAMLQEFKSYVKAQLPTIYDETGFNADLEFIRAMIRYEVDIQLFDVATARRHLLDKDPQAQYALGLFGEAETLLKAAPDTSKAVNR
jgi:carboxyl-terminal processing protease